MTLKKYLFPLILALIFQVTVVKAGKGQEAPPMADLVEDPFAEFGSRASTDLSPKAEILRDITAHNNKKLQKMLTSSVIAEREFAKAMAKKATQFNNPQALDLLFGVYKHHVHNAQDHEYHGYVTAQLELESVAGEEYGFSNRKEALENLIKKHPISKVFILGYALEGAARGGHADLVDWILTAHLSDLKARKSFAVYACDHAMALAIENYHPEIAVKIGNLHSQGLALDPFLALEYAYLVRDKESFLFLKKNFPKAYGRFVTEKKKDRI